MLRPARNRLPPWIESLVLSYGSEEEGRSGRLKADVIGVGQMSQSQAHSSDCPTGLLFLSDGVLQIPAVLTTAAWEHLQEQEDRESFASLMNTTVIIQDYRLQFHMVPEQTKCRFFLSVGELATTAAGPVKDNTPCCTTLPSVRLKICKTWRLLLGQEELQESQASQCGFDLSELLGQWQHDCVQDLLDHVRMTVTSISPASEQPSTSTPTPLNTHPDPPTATSWDVDRVRFKGEEGFSVPVSSLIIPEDDARQQREPSSVSEDEDAERRAEPLLAGERGATGENSPLSEDEGLLTGVLIAGTVGGDIRPLANPWDMFSPPCDTSTSSDVSTPTQEPRGPTAAAALSSMELHVHSTKESQHASGQSKEEHSYLPPYQKPLSFHSATASPLTSASPPEPLSGPSHPLPTTDELHTGTAQQEPLALDQEDHVQETGFEGTVGRKQRKRSDPPPEESAVQEDEEEQKSGSPPSWLFDSRTDEEDSSRPQGRPALRKTPSVHSDGRPFSYSYQQSGRNLQDLSLLRVSGSWLQWAVKYLLPKADHQTSSDRTAEVASLSHR